MTMKAPIIATAMAALVGTAAVAGEQENFSRFISFDRAAAMAKALDLCFQHSFSTLTLVGCAPARMCNRAYEDEWKEPCLAIEKTWHEGGFEDQAKRESGKQDARDLNFVRSLAGMGQN
jgi:hypothetical protein